MMMMRPPGFLLRSILLISASNRSSCERSARSTPQTPAKRLLSFKIVAGSVPAGTAIGRTIYPYSLPAALRIARPTPWTMSTCEFRGLMNSTASSAGTSMPSERHRAFDRMRQDPGVVPLSHSIRALRSSAWCWPSTWRVSHRNALARWSLGKRSMAWPTRSSQYFSSRLDATIVFVNAIARRSRKVCPFPLESFSGFCRARQHPTIFAASVMLISLSLSSSLRCLWTAPSTRSSDIASTTTL